MSDMINVAEWVKAQKALGLPLFDLWRKLMEKWGQAKELDLIKEYMDAANKIEDILVSRNLDGKEYEQNGENNKAIELYEANIKDRFDGSHPYDRLRIIYTRMKKYDDAIRVCEAYIHNGQLDPQLKSKYQEIISNLRTRLG
jgi:tetratricopeptide (TPR) repeat protein